MQRKLRIVLSSVCHISQYYGGNENYLHNLALGLAKDGHEVTYLTAFAKSEINKYPYDLKIVPVGTLMGKPLPSLEWTNTVVGIKPDVFHGSGSGLPMVLSAGILKHNYEIPTVLTFQAPLHPDNKLMQLAGKGETFVSGRAFDAVIATGPQNQAMLRSWWPWVKIELIPMMLADHFFAKQPTPTEARRKLKLGEDRPTVLFAGKLDTHHYYKGVDFLLQATSLLPKEYQVVIIGDGNTRQVYETKAKELRISNQVIFVGFVRDETVRDYMVGSDVFVLPSTSDSEGFGLVLIEAMACNTPVVTTTVIGSASWLKAEKVATLVPAKDAKALAKAIVKQAEHRDDKQVARARKIALSFTKEKMVESTVKLYRELINKKQK